MNLLIKSARINLTLLIGLLAETVIVQGESSGKSMAVSVTMNKDGSSLVMYTVYDNQKVPVINTPNIQDAMNRYNSINQRIEPEPVGDVIF